MSSKKKSSSKLDSEQRELYETAHRRTVQKKRLFQHFVIFLVGAVLLIIINVVIGYKEDFMPLGYNWFVWAILIWAFFFLVHLLNVFVINSFMNKEWEQHQLEKLVRKQQDRIAQLQKKVEKDHPLPQEEQKPAPTRISKNDPRNPDQPLNH